MPTPVVGLTTQKPIVHLGQTVGSANPVLTSAERQKIPVLKILSSRADGCHLSAFPAVAVTFHKKAPALAFLPSPYTVGSHSYHVFPVPFPPYGIRPTLNKCHAGPQRKTKRRRKCQKSKLLRFLGRRSRLVCTFFLLCLEFCWKTLARKLFREVWTGVFTLWRRKMFLFVCGETSNFFLTARCFFLVCNFFRHQRRRSVPTRKKKAWQPVHLQHSLQSAIGF